MNNAICVLCALLAHCLGSMQPGDSQPPPGAGVLPSGHRNRCGAIVDFNAKQFTKALDAEAKALRSIHVFLSKTLKNLEVERTCLDVMARTVSSKCSDASLGTLTMQHGPEVPAGRLAQTEQDACSRFCENLLPTCEVDSDENQEDIHSLLAGSTADPVSFFPQAQPRRTKRILGERKGKRKKAHVSVNEQQDNGAQDALGKESSMGEDTNCSFDGAHDEFCELEASEGLDLALTSALQDAKELLADAPVVADDGRYDCLGTENLPAPDPAVAFSSDGLFLDEGLAAIQDMNAILDSDLL